MRACVCVPVKARTECEIDKINKGNTKHIQNTIHPAHIFWLSFILSHFVSLTCSLPHFWQYTYAHISIVLYEIDLMGFLLTDTIAMLHATATTAAQQSNIKKDSLTQ